ncbi:hypothetical protein QUF73_19715 [Cytobacillus sp. NJ13]|nr:hypothetical protein [Cytobacillus sp. NJ13]
MKIIRFYTPIDKVILNTDEEKVAANIEFRGKNNGGEFDSKKRDASRIGFIAETEPLKVKTVKIITLAKLPIKRITQLQNHKKLPLNLNKRFKNEIYK